MSAELDPRGDDATQGASPIGLAPELAVTQRRLTHAEEVAAPDAPPAAIIEVSSSAGNASAGNASELPVTTPRLTMPSALEASALEASALEASALEAPAVPHTSPERAPYAGPLSLSTAPPLPAPRTPPPSTPLPPGPMMRTSRPSTPIAPAPDHPAAAPYTRDTPAARAVAAEEEQAEEQRPPLLSAPLVVSDRGAAFAVVAALAWLALVAFPLTLSLALVQPANGLPLLGVAVWLVFLRLARRLSPPARADRLLRQGRYAAALASCDASLDVTGEGAWVGRRRLIWLNRRTSALLGLGRYDEALRASLTAMEQSADPETIATCALALLRLNRYQDAIAAARLVSGVTHERSVRANATLAAAMLARGLPVEADALAGASLADIEALSPYVRRESHAMCLSALVRARRAQGRLDGPEGARAALARLKRLAGYDAVPRAIALLEEAALLADASDAHDPAAWEEVERLARTARALAPGYTLWRLTQHDAPLTSMTGYLQDGLRAQAERAPASGAVGALLRQASADLQPRPPRLSNSTALLAQIITVAATLALLALWTVMFFVVYAA